MNDSLPTAEVEASAGPTDAEIAIVRDTAEKAMSLTMEIARLNDELERANAGLKLLLEATLPNAMIAARLEAWPIANGSQYVLNKMVAGSITKENLPAAHAWLEEHGHGDMIKRKITIQFGRDQVSWAKKFLADCRKRKTPLNMETNEWVEPMTLGAFVREQEKLAVAEARDPEELIPSNLFSVFRLTYAKLVEPKEKRERRVTARSR